MIWLEEWKTNSWGERFGQVAGTVIALGLWAVVLFFTFAGFSDLPPDERRWAIFAGIVLVALYNIWSILKQILHVLQGIHRMIYIARNQG